MQPRTIMVVDDEPVIRLLFESQIKEAGHEALLFSNVPEATAFLSKSKRGVPNHRRIALIICDLKMPSGSGYDVLAARNEADITIPFYLLSGNARAQDVAVMMTSHLSGYLEKPLFPWDITAFLQRALPERIESPRPAAVLAVTEALKEPLGKLAALQDGPNQLIIIAPAGTSPLSELGSDLAATYAQIEVNARTIAASMKAASIKPTELCSTSFSWEKFGGKALILGSAPRHLSTGHTGIVPSTSPTYPNVPLGDTIAHAILAAQLFGSPSVGVIGPATPSPIAAALSRKLGIAIVPVRSPDEFVPQSIKTARKA